MEHHKISKLLNDSSVSKFVTTNYLYGDHYSVNKNVRFKTPTLGSENRSQNKYYRH